MWPSQVCPKHNTARMGVSKAGAGSIPVRPTMGVGCERHTLAGSGQVIPASGERWACNTQPQRVCGSAYSKGPSTLPAPYPPHIVKEIQVVCDMSADAFNRLYAHFCRYPSFRDVLLRSDPVMYERLARITLPAKPTRKKKK